MSPSNKLLLDWPQAAKQSQPALIIRLRTTVFLRMVPPLHLPLASG
jgi:hypothetical protein